MTQAILAPSARATAWRICIFFTFAAAILMMVTDTAVEIGSLATVAGVVYTLAGLHFVYTRLRPDPFVGPIAGGLAIVSWAGFVAGAAALTALRTDAPLIDAWLAHADALLGVDTPALVAWLARHSVMGLLLVAYKTAVPLVLAAVIFLGWTQRHARMWELGVAYAGSAATCALLSAVVPAVGAFIHYRIGPDVLALLPPRAGVYYLPTFYAYRSGLLDTVDLGHFDGVVTFPSFHAAMALMVGYAVRDVRWLRGPACIWSGLTLLSTMPIGGHYAVDVLAGAAVWAAFAMPYRIARNWEFGRQPERKRTGSLGVEVERLMFNAKLALVPRWRRSA